MNWNDLTRDEIAREIESGRRIAILPVGSIEQHGPHLGVAYDTLVAERLAVDLAADLCALILPSFQYGSAEHHLGFPGTLSLSEDTFIAILNDLARSLVKSGISALVIVNGHGGNYGPIQRFAHEWHCPELKVITDDNERLIFATIASLTSEYSAADLGLHGGLFETSLALHTHPQHVRRNAMARGLMPPRPSGWSVEEIRRIMASGLRDSTESGVIGDPTESSAEMGSKFYAGLLEGYRKICIKALSE